MQPRTLVLIITILPLLATNGVYLLSAYQGFIPWCIPYIDGCTTISQAARSGNSIFIYRASMITYGVLLIVFWIYAQQWLNLLYGHTTKIARIILPAKFFRFEGRGYRWNPRKHLDGNNSDHWRYRFISTAPLSCRND